MMTLRTYLVILMIITSGVLLPLFTSTQIKMENRQFRDESGRVRVFHGVNVVYKVAPYIPSNGDFDPFLSFNDEDIKVYMKRFGFNLVRLGVMWEALEKQPGVFDEELLDKYVNLVNKLGENGIYTIVDAHQDLFSRQLCGEGVPHFYVNELEYDRDCRSSLIKQLVHLLGVCKGMAEYNLKTDEDGLPLIEECQKNSFGKYHTSPDLTSLYAKLFKNEKGLLDKFINFWLVVANKFKNNPYVLGYDIWNEPVPGDMYNHPTNFIPGFSDNYQLLSFYRKVDEKIREVDSEYTLMFEPTPADNIPVVWKYYKRTFSELPLKNNSKDKQIYNFHSYCCNASLDMCSAGEPPMDQKDLCKQMHVSNAKTAHEFSKKFGVGSILTEFGACFDSESCYNEVTSVADEMDKYFFSWAYWMYKPFKDFTTSCTDDKEGMFNKDGTVQVWKERALTRSYVQAFQGEPISMHFNQIDKSLKFEFFVDFDIDQPTVVYYNQHFNYRDGVDVHVEDLTNRVNHSVDFSENNLLKIRITRKENVSLFEENVKVLVVISPKI